MIDLDNLKSFFPTNVQNKRSDILREYLQCVMLEIIFDSAYGQRLTFLGGTCLRIVHDSQRFSEDLDFDNDGLSESEFSEFGRLVEKELTLRGYAVEMQIKGKTAYRCTIKFPRMLYDYGLAAIPDQKLSIQIDTQAQQFYFQPEFVILNRFGVFAQIATTPLDIIFSQKCHAILERPRNKGRDFFDVVYLLSRRVKPNYDYLAQKLHIHNASQLRERILTHWAIINVNEQMADVEGFLFSSKDLRKIALFGEIVKEAEL